MAEAALRNDGGTPKERAHRMVEAAVLVGLAARRAAEIGDVISNFWGSGDYRGEVRDGKARGLGITRYEDGSVFYEGEWRNGKPNGLGVNRWNDGSIIYAGQWQDNRRHGLGIKRDDDGSVDHAGWWKKGEESKSAP
eukprot:GHVU01202681.1.p2 GENE.GHVU01202681.1~~GHVU01202681.1.p2  ORF type:complete len:159 (+),score=26.35 GHVU01202681.1:67-477(+)